MATPRSTASRPPYDVMVIDNQDVVRAGLLSLQAMRPDLVRSMVTFADISDIDLGAPAPDVVILDYWLGRDTRPSLEHVPALKAWGAHVLLYTSEEAPVPLRRALGMGIDGLCLKNDGMRALAEAVGVVGSGRTAFSGPLARAALDDASFGAVLTEREAQVLQGLAHGLTNQEVARRLFISSDTVRTHVEHIRDKYVASTGSRVNRAKMMREGQRDGYLAPRPMEQDPPFA